MYTRLWSGCAETERRRELNDLERASEQAERPAQRRIHSVREYAIVQSII